MFIKAHRQETAPLRQSASYSCRDSSLEITFGQPHRHSRNAANGSQVRIKSRPCCSVEPCRNDEVKGLKKFDSNATQRSSEKISDRDVPTHLSPTADDNNLYWVCCGGPLGNCPTRGTWLWVLHDYCDGCSHLRCNNCRKLVHEGTE